MSPDNLQEYEAVLNSVGLLDFRHRAKIEISGKDRVGFLHNMITNEVNRLPDFSGQYGTLLTPRGKIIADFFYYRFPEFLLLDQERELAPRTIQTLEKYIIMDEVFLRDLSDDLGHFSLQGPRSLDLAQAVLGCAVAPVEFELREVMWGEARVWLIRKNTLAPQGCELIVPRSAASVLRQELLEKGVPFGVRMISQETENVLRLEASIPRFGIDMDESHYPMEARLDTAISLTKGCYMGQEVVARAINLGGVSKLLMGIKIQGKAPRRGSRILDTEGKEIGIVTSAEFSPRLSHAIALGYIKRSFANPGRICEVEFSEGQRVAGEIVNKFL
ncbi:MAG: aminomethyl transferase family protein [Acidobacteria bacterium]|nr:aminomethyl transferase family protein [Acidobacteriota bacterium]